MDETTRYDGSTGDKSSATHSHTESDPRTLRDGQSIEELRATVDDLERLVAEQDELLLEVLERLELIEARLNGLETEDRQPNAQVIDPSGESVTTGGPHQVTDPEELTWGAANGAAERLEGER